MTRRKPSAATTKRRLVIDELALSMRKPRAGPLIDPEEAIAIALSMLPSSTGFICSPDAPAVRLIMHSLKSAGWKIEAI